MKIDWQAAPQAALIFVALVIAYSCGYNRGRSDFGLAGKVYCHNCVTTVEYRTASPAPVTCSRVLASDPIYKWVKRRCVVTPEGTR